MTGPTRPTAAPRPPRPGGRRVVVGLAVLVTVFAGCGSTSSAPPGPPSPTASRPTPALTPVPTSAFHPSPSATPAPPTRTKTDWGTIWDGLPRGFPTPPGAEPTDTGDQAPVSAAFAVAASASDTADWYRTNLPGGGYSVEGLSGPYENGGFVIDAVGASPDCVVQVTIAKTGTITTATILFGAACPFR